MSLDGKNEEDPPRAIRLDDRTIPFSKRDSPTKSVEQRFSASPRGGSLALNRSRGDTIRRELTRRKYARFQEGRYDGDDQENAGDDRENEGGTGISSHKHARNSSYGDPLAGTDRTPPSLLPPRVPKPPERPQKPSERDYTVEILYENQRGWFFCGIPLYSSRSLLNFDPAPWQTGDFKDSPVNITNAQVPDPTWAWAWPSWYVDMSHDVDDEGWEYSFSFRQGFAWHGSSPWWTSYVRRRRWLRKRVRAHATHGIQDAWHQAHQLNPDYFTIHGALGAAASSHSSSLERSSRPSSKLLGPTPLAAEATGEESDTDDERETGIPNVAALLNRLKCTTVDRKKLDAFRRFLSQGGAELHYLADTMPEIMALFIYQHSRREALAELERAHEIAQSGQIEVVRNESDPPSAPVPTVTLDPTTTSNVNIARDLQHAIDAVTAHVHSHDLAPDGTIRSPSSAHYQYHYNRYQSHHTHPSLSSHHHARSISSNQQAESPNDPSSTISPRVRAHATHEAEIDARSLRTTTTATSHDGIANPYATPSRSAAGSVVDLGSSPTREVGEGWARIKGIPEAAHIGEDMGIAARMEAEVAALNEREEATERKQVKGKGKDRANGKGREKETEERKERLEWQDDGVD